MPVVETAEQPAPAQATEIHFGAWLRAKRLALGWEIKHLSRHAGISEPTLTLYEKCATPHMYESMYRRLAMVFGMTLEELDAAWRSSPVPVDRPRWVRPGRRPSPLQLAVYAIVRADRPRRAAEFSRLPTADREALLHDLMGLCGKEPS